MKHVRVRALALALVVCAWSCSRSPASHVTTPPPPPPEPPSAPTSLTLDPTAFWGRYDVAWAAPPGVISGYEMEGRVDDGPFDKMHEGLLPAWQTSGWVDAWDVPELAWIHLRIRAVRDGLVSEWSNVASVRQGLKAPIQIQAETSGDGPAIAAAPVVVSWVLPSPALTADIVLERAEGWVAGPVWAPIPGLAPGQTSYSDHDVEDGRSYQYRLHRTADGVTSPTVASNPTSYLAVLAPTEPAVSLLTPDLATEPVGFHVTWTNRSATADLATIERQTVLDMYSFTIGTAGVAGPYDDLQWPQWPGARYRIWAFRTNTTAQSGVSDWIAAPGFTLSGALVLDASTVVVPAGEGFAQDGAGRIHVLRPRTFGGSVPSILRSIDGGWETHALEGEIGVIVAPGITLDPDGHPHVAYSLVHPFQAETYTVRHAWYDGAAWQSADLELQVNETATAFGAGPSGAAHLIYTRPSSGTTTLVYAEWRGGACTQSVLPAVGFYSAPTALQVEADGTLVLAVPALDGLGFAVAVRPPGGTWAIEHVPDVAPFSGRSWFAAGDGGRAAIVFQRIAADQVQFWSVRRDGSASYSPAALVATGPFVGREHRAELALTPEGARSIFVVDLADDAGAQHTEIFVRGATGGWHRMRIGPLGVHPRPSFAPDGKVRILGAIARVGSASQALPLLTER